MLPQSSILVVDDDDVVRLSYQRSLQSSCGRVEAVADGEKALQAMKREAFDVVLLDLRMPGMDGISVLKQIKQLWPRAEVVVITGYPTIETAKEAMQLGACDYLAKPVGPDEVIHAANEAMTQKVWGLHTEHNGGLAA
jgi:DNA-binding NtrC family response regulator